MKLSKSEQETIVLFNEQDDTAEIYTHNMKLKKRLVEFMKKHPELVEHKNTGQDALTVIVPKNLLTVTVRFPLSERELQLRRERAKQNSPFIKTTAMAQ